MRRVRHAGHLVDHFDMGDVTRAQRVGGTGEHEQDVVVGHHMLRTGTPVPPASYPADRALRARAVRLRIRTTRPSPRSVAPETPSTLIIVSAIARTTISRCPAMRSMATAIASSPAPTT